MFRSIIKNFGEILAGAFVLLFLFFIAVFGSAAFGQDLPIEVVPDAAFLTALVGSLGGLPGAGTLGAVGTVVQLLIMFLKTPLSGNLFRGLSGFAKWALVLVLSIVGGVVGLKVQGLDLMAALTHSSVLGLVMIGLNQGLKHYSESKQDSAPVIK